MSVKWQVSDPQHVSLRGELNRHSLGALAETAKLLNGLVTPVIVDLAQLTRVDSAGVAQLLELKEQAASRGLALTFQGSGHSLSRLLALYGLEEII